MHKPARLPRGIGLGFLALIAAGCIGGPPPSGLNLIIENRSQANVQVLWPDVTGSSNPDSLSSCLRTARGIEPGQHIIDITSLRARAGTSWTIRAVTAMLAAWCVLKAGPDQRV